LNFSQDKLSIAAVLLARFASTIELKYRIIPNERT